MTSMLSDLSKHPETEGSVRAVGPIMLGLFLLPPGQSGSLQNPHEMRKFINGFN